MQSIMSKIYQFMLVLLSVVCVIIASEGIILKAFVLSPDYWLKVTEKSDYIEDTTKEINQAIEDLGLGSGIKAGALSSVITEEQVKEDFNSFLGNALKGTPFTIDQEKIKKQIYTSVEEYAKKEDQKINKKNKDSVNQFVDAAYQKYDRGIRNQVISIIGLRTSMVDKLLTMVVGGAIGSFLLLLVFMFFAGAKYRHIFFRNLSHLLATTSLLLVFANGVYYYNEPLKDLTIFTRSMKELIEKGLEMPLLINWILAGVFLLLSAYLGFISYNEYLKLKRNRVIKKNRREA